jgi:lysophospholipase L1-like esterase
MNRFLYQISIANLCENLGVNYIMYNGIDDILSYRDLENTDNPSGLVKKIKTYLNIKRDGYVHNVYDDFDNLYEVLSTKNFLDIPCTGYFGYETGRYKKDTERSKKYLYDGLHMNKLGHQEWEKILEDFIIEKGMGDFIK